MSTINLQPNHLETPPLGSGARSGLGYDFALLGLAARESRVDVIRSACMRTSKRIHSSGAASPQELEEMLADLATSTYRLLDPRNRTRQRERIHLSLYSELDWELQKRAQLPLLKPRQVEVSNRLALSARVNKANRVVKAFRRAGSIGASGLAWLLTGCILTLCLGKLF